MKIVLVGGLEAAKAPLENPSTSVDRLRVCQGMASAYRSMHNFLLDLGKSEVKDAG